MKLVLHIVRKDLRRLRGWLLAWLVVLALPVLTGFRLLNHDPLDERAWSLPNDIGWLMGFEGVMAYLLIVLLIQEDAIVGTRQFWLTRPITGRRLLAAKALAAAIILWVMPVAVSLPWWLWCGFGPREILFGVMDICIATILIAVPAALVAVLTDTVARALLWSMVLVATVLIGILFFGIVAAQSVRDQNGIAVLVSRDFLAVAALTVEIALIVIFQYHRRRHGRWLFIAGLAMFATVVATSQWRGVLIGRTEPEAHDAGRAAEVNLRVERIKAGERPSAQRGEENFWQRIDLDLTATGVPAGLTLAGIGVQARWRWPEGALLDRLDPIYEGWWRGAAEVDGLRAYPPSEFGEDEETRRYLAAVRKSRKQPPVGPPPPKSTEAVTVHSYFRPSIVAKMEVNPPAYSGRAWLELQRTELDFESPLAPGGWQRHQGGALRVARVEFGRSFRRSEDGAAPGPGIIPGNTQTVRCVQTRGASLYEVVHRLAENGAWFRWYPRFDMSVRYVELNRAQGKFIELWDSGSNSRDVVINGVWVRWRAQPVDPPRIVRDGKWVTVPGWMSSVTVGVISTRSEAVFSREVKIDRFQPTTNGVP